MSKGFIGFILGLAAGVALVFAYLHKAAIFACVKGEELPDAPECCPVKQRATTLKRLRRSLSPDSQIIKRDPTSETQTNDLIFGGRVFL